MKEKLKRIINLIVLAILAIVTFIAVKSIPNLLVGKTEEVTKVAGTEILDMAPGAAFEVNTSNTEKIASSIAGDGDYWKVTVSGISQIYCAEKGAHLSRQGGTYEDIVAYVNAHIGDTGDNHCAVPAEKNSRPYYKVSSVRAATNAEAFLLTWPTDAGGNWDDWLSYKQEAIWDSSSLSNNRKPPKDTIDGLIGNQLVSYSSFYGAFADEIQANGSKIVKKDTTDQNKVKKSATQSTKEYIVGPFSIDYINGMYGLVFGGISDMYIVGEKTPRIEIKSFIIDNVEITPTYFKTIDDKNLVALGTQGYPKPNEQFYVKYISTTDEQINKLHVDFEWMQAESTITYYDAYKYKSSFTDSHTRYCPGHKGSHNDDCDPWCSDNHTWHCNNGCKYKCKVTGGKVVEYSAGYQRLLSATGTRWINKESLEIKIPDHTEPPTPTPPPTKNLQIKLSGKVWEDEQSGKESLPNGVKDSNENYKAGVEVILHYSDGSEVKRTVTDNNGYYEFTNLNGQKKYYIEFVYDGQIYQATQYNTGLSKEQRLVGGVTNATEVVSERETFNNNFAHISSAPGSYTVRRSLYYSAGSTNTAYIVSKPSTETPYGIKEIYEYVISQATSTKSYQTAYANALSNFGDNVSTRSKLQFIEDCRISSYTGYDTSRQLYPIWDRFTESYESKVIAGKYYYALYPKHLNIDFGLARRETFDLALRKDVAYATLDINGKTHTYDYNTRQNMDEQDGGTWDINVRLSDAYYNSSYSREIFKSDYEYKVEDYGNQEAQNAYDKKIEDELEIYITYKLTVRNQSQSVLGEVMEIVDYYDKDFTYVNDEKHRSYIEIKRGNNSGEHDVNVVLDTSMYGDSNSTNIDGYNRLYVRGLQGMQLTSGQTAYVYLTFKVNKDTARNVLLDEDVATGNTANFGVGKENIAEINGFKTYYANGTQVPNLGDVSGKVAGLFDVDSVPGNINPNDVPKDGNINYANFEDDTDKAPNIRVRLYRDDDRIIDGIAWEDIRNVQNKDQKTSVGNGLKDSNEEGINGVTVQLVELMDNGTEYIWKTFSTGEGTYTPIINKNNLVSTETSNERGKYVFKSYVPGNYVVRFIYGDTVKTVLPNTSTEVTNTLQEQGQNAKSYNGQDYKSTTYQAGITQTDNTFMLAYANSRYALSRIETYKNYNTQNSTGKYLYDIAASDAITNASDAKDIMVDNDNIYGRNNLNSREEVENYSNSSEKQNETNYIKNHIAEVLASSEKVPTYLGTSYSKEQMQSLIDEFMSNTQMTAETGAINVEVEYNRTDTGNQTVDNTTKYQIKDVNLGLEERPKAQLAIDKQVTNVKLTLADGSTLFDATQTASNVLWKKHKAYEFNYKDNKLTGDPMATIREKDNYDLTYGLVQMTMDEELMHGATIKISYKITVTNVGEVDYKDNQFYYTGVVSDSNTIVKTTANKLVDYVANNLQFYAVDNDAWEVMTKDNLIANGLVNSALNTQMAKYNTIIVTKDNSKLATTALVPEFYGSQTSSVDEDLVLTQLITSENKTDDLTYRNIVEIVKMSNDVGRRSAYSVVGNQDPTLDVTEVDSNVSEIVKILPPFGNAGTYYMIGIAILLASSILVVGIIFIKKKVLK